MGKFYVPSNSKFKGPWLVGQDSLEDLDRVIEDINKELGKALEKHIEKTLKQQPEEDTTLANDITKRTLDLKRKYSEVSKTIKLVFDDGTGYYADSMKGAINHINSRGYKPKELYISVVNGGSENEFRFSLSITKDGDNEVDQLEYQIKCLDEEVQDDIKGVIDRWKGEIQPPKALIQWLDNIRILIWFVCFFTIIIGFGNRNDKISEVDDYKAQLKNEIQKILKDSVSQKNINQSVALLLKYETDYVPENIKTQEKTVPNPFYRKMLLISILLVLISLHNVKTTIGIGKNKNRYAFNKFWTKSLLITIPSAFAPWLLDIAKEWIHSFVN